MKSRVFATVNKVTKTPLAAAVGLLMMGGVSASANAADSIADAIKEGSSKLNMNMRYESVSQDNALKDADGLTLRTRLTYSTADYKGFSATLEFEDSRTVLGMGDFSVPQVGYQGGVYSVIADPDHTEVDQMFVSYKGDGFSAKIGRQVLTMDNHRFVGHVGWRQDRQTFDALSVTYTKVDNLTLNYAYLNKRNRIFADVLDVESNDHLFNASYKTSLGTVTGYAYLLEVDNGLTNGLDTYGVRFAGAKNVDDVKYLYSAEFATQSSETAATDYDASYLALEGGVVISGITAKVGYESLGSDDAMYGFSTPLATLHKFNGWADIFLGTPSQGLVDTYVSVGGKVAGGKLMGVFHSFEADEATDTVDDLGTEFDLVYTYKLAKNYTLGAKLASYSGDSGRPDTDKVWLWVSAAF